MSVKNIAVISADGCYRYLLTREISQRDLLLPDRGVLLVVMLNPSTADAHDDDPTVRKLVAYAERWGYSRLVVVNLYALRSPYPTDLLEAEDPVGPANDAAIREAAAGADTVVAAWGMGPSPSLKIAARARAVIEMIGKPLYCLQVNDDGSPRHPLYLPGNAELSPYPPAAPSHPPRYPPRKTP